jgi:hypothetical protein
MDKLTRARKFAKHVDWSRSPATIMILANISPEKAKALVDAYLDKFPCVKEPGNAKG